MNVISSVLSCPKGTLRTLTKEDHPAGVFIIVEKVQKDNTLHEDISEN
jgi:hypothetical protein